MNLHLTINSRLVDSTPINPDDRWDKEYIEAKKDVLRSKHQEALKEQKAAVEFYVDPAGEEGGRNIPPT